MPSAMAACPLPQRKGSSNRVYSRNHIAQGRLQFGGRNMLRIQPSQDLPANRFVVWRAVWEAPNSQA